MINYGEFEIEDILNDSNIILRIAFKEKDIKDALNYCQKLKDKNISFFINPMHTNKYKKENLDYLIKKTNDIKPLALTITDTIGELDEFKIKKIFNYINEKLDKEIAICFHSHNNLNLSFNNAKEIIKENVNRQIIIDSTIDGIGRGAGNLKTQDIANYLNNNYDINLIHKLSKEIIQPIYKQKSWGYCEIYKICAKNGCHPNYANFLIEKNIDIKKCELIFKQIPDEEKLIYNQKLIEYFMQNLLVNANMY